MHQHVAAGNVDLVFQGQGDGLAGTGLLQFALEGDDGFHLAALARRQGHHPSPLRTTPLARVPAKPRKFRFGRFTYCTGKRMSSRFGCDLDGFEDFHQRLAGVPGRTLGLVDHVVAP